MQKQKTCRKENWTRRKTHHIEVVVGFVMRHAGWFRSSNVTLNKRHDKVGGGVTEARTLDSRYVSYTLSDWALCSKLCITVILSRTRKLEPSSTVERHCTRTRRSTLIAGKFAAVPGAVNAKINLTFNPEQRLWRLKKHILTHEPYLYLCSLLYISTVFYCPFIYYIRVYHYSQLLFLSYNIKLNSQRMCSKHHIFLRNWQLLLL